MPPEAGTRFQAGEQSLTMKVQRSRQVAGGQRGKERAIPSMDPSSSRRGFSPRPTGGKRFHDRAAGAGAQQSDLDQFSAAAPRRSPGEGDPPGVLDVWVNQLPEHDSPVGGMV